MFDGWKTLHGYEPGLIEATEKANGEFSDEVLNRVRKDEISAYETPQGYLVVADEFPELVAVTFAGKNGRKGLEQLKAIAKLHGFKNIRIHGETLAIGRLYNIGEPCEYIWRVPV